MHNGEIAFAYGPCFPNATQFQGSRGIPGDEHDSAGLPVETIDHLWLGSISQVQPHSANETGISVTFGRMADEPGWLVNDQQIVAFVDDRKEQARQGPSCDGCPIPPQNSRGQT